MAQPRRRPSPIVRPAVKWTMAGEFMRFVTASLKVDFLRPTPIGVELVIRGQLRSIEGRKVQLALALSEAERTCATGQMLAIQLRN